MKKGDQNVISKMMRVSKNELPIKNHLDTSTIVCELFDRSNHANEILNCPN